MELKKILKKMLNSACIIFTVCTALYMLAMLIIHVGDDAVPIEAGRVLLIFVFSVLLSIANALLSIEQIHVALRYVIHYSITAFGFWACFCLPNRMNFSRSLVGIVLFSIVYAIIMPITRFFARKLKKLKEPKKKYQKQFSKKHK